MNATVFECLAGCLTTHSTGRAISESLIENLDSFGGLCAPVNSGVGLLRTATGLSRMARFPYYGAHSRTPFNAYLLG